MQAIAETGIYTVGEAARLTQVPRATAQHWMELGVTAHPEFREESVRALVSFEDLISLFTVRRLRNAKVPLDDIKRAENHLAQLWAVRKPFAHGWIRTRYGAIVAVLTEGERAVAIGSGAIQEILLELVEKDLHDVTFDATERARQWTPARYVVIAPSRQLGRPCVEGTRITTRTVFQFINGGDTVEELSEDLEIPLVKVRAAYQFEEELAKRRN